MTWLQLTLESNRDDAEQLTEILERFGALSVSLSAVSKKEIFGQAPETAPTYWDKTRLVAMLHADTDLDTLLVCLRDNVGGENIFCHQITSLDDRDWVSEYRQQNGPRCYGGSLWVTPSWCAPPADAGSTLILDPGLAFGTGSHETTSLCLEWLTGVPLEGKTVIDYGCGSGILGLAAIALGANHVYAIDIDPQALTSTRKNAERNYSADRITIAKPEEITLSAAEILLANVLLKPLLELAPRFAELVFTDGRLVLSGLLATQADECLAAYAGWFNMHTPVFSREWTLLEGIRK